MGIHKEFRNNYKNIYKYKRGKIKVRRKADVVRR